MKSISVSISKAAIWLPEKKESASQIAKKSNMNENYIKDKLGIHYKCVAEQTTKPSDMAIKAAKKILLNEQKNDINVIIWAGSEYKDHYLWSASTYIQDKLNLQNAWSFDLFTQSTSDIVALRIAKNILLSDQQVKKILICSGHKLSNFINYKDKDTSFLFSLADGGSAILIERGTENEILESSNITDGTFSLDVLVQNNNHFFKVENKFSLLSKLTLKSINNYCNVINESKKKSIGNKKIDYLALNHMNKGSYQKILETINISYNKSLYLEEYGHIGSIDPLLSLGIAEQKNKLFPGNTICLVSAGLGYNWSAICIKWTKQIIDSNFY